MLEKVAFSNEEFDEGSTLIGKQNVAALLISDSPFLAYFFHLSY